MTEKPHIRTALGWAFELAPILRLPNGEIDANARLVLLAMAHFATGTTGGNVYPKIVRLAAAAGLSVRSTRLALARLTRAGLIERDGMHGTVPRWRLRLDVVATPTPLETAEAYEREVTRKASERRASERRKLRAAPPKGGDDETPCRYVPGSDNTDAGTPKSATVATTAVATVATSPVATTTPVATTDVATSLRPRSDIPALTSENAAYQVPDRVTNDQVGGDDLQAATPIPGDAAAPPGDDAEQADDQQAGAEDDATRLASPEPVPFTDSRDAKDRGIPDASLASPPTRDQRARALLAEANACTDLDRVRRLARDARHDGTSTHSIDGAPLRDQLAARIDQLADSAKPTPEPAPLPRNVFTAEDASRMWGIPINVPVRGGSA